MSVDPLSPGPAISAPGAAPGAPTTCSAVSAIDEPLPGTAAQASAWLCVEHPGPWGRDVVASAVLGPELTAELAQRCADAGVRLQLIRTPRVARSLQERLDSVRVPPSRLALTGDAGQPWEATRSTQPDGLITVFLARSVPGQTWVRRLRLRDFTELLDVDLDAANRAEPPSVGESCTEPIALVCAHGKRDQCCARFGRTVAVALGGQYPGQVWETSHTGGHRFAPSMIVLPTGYTYGRLDVAASAEVIAQAERGEVGLAGLRGRSCYGPDGQAAEVAVRTREKLLGEADVWVDESGSVAIVIRREGRSWAVTLDRAQLAPRFVSCGDAAKPVTARHVRMIRSLEK